MADRDPLIAHRNRDALARYSESMRLTAEEQQGIALAAAMTLPPGARVSLFGSRVDDTKRGGDVDLLVEVPTQPSPDEEVRLSNRFVAQLYRRIGERRIDLLVCTRGRPDPRPVVAAARRDAIVLATT